MFNIHPLSLCPLLLVCRALRDVRLRAFRARGLEAQPRIIVLVSGNPSLCREPDGFFSSLAMPPVARLPPELQPPLPLAAAAVCGAAFAAAALWSWRRRAPPSADDPPIVLVVRIRVAPGRRAAFLKLWSAYAAYVARSESGVLSYAAAAAEASPDELVLLQRCVPGGRTRQLARRRRRRWEHRRATLFRPPPARRMPAAATPRAKRSPRTNAALPF